MHAVVIRVKINDAEAATGELQERVVPRVSQLPGFVAGYWTRGQDGGGLSMVVFDSEDGARAASEAIPSGMPAAVELENMEIREVVANA